MPKTTRAPYLKHVDEGEYVRATTGKDMQYRMVLDEDMNVVRVEPYTGPKPERYRAPAGMPIEPADWCEPSHDTCDLNLAVELPPWRPVEWRYGGHPMRSLDRRATQICVACFEAMYAAHEDSCDWSVIEAKRAEAAEVAA